MRIRELLTGLSIAGLATLALAAGAVDARSQTPPAEPPPPTPIEDALLEHACGAMHPPGSIETEAYLDCRKNRLLYLRAEYGRDLRRLTATERKTVDAACSEVRLLRGQDAYVTCLQVQLAALPGHKTQAPVAATAAAVPAPASPPPVAAAPAAPPPSFPVVWLGAGLAALVVAGGAGALVLKKRTPRASGKCRTCGATLKERGELCHACRHAAAETMRQTRTTSADDARIEQEAQRQLAAREREQQQRAREEETRRRELEAAQAAQARQREDDEKRRREDDAWRQRELAVTAASDEFDPHAVLGVPRGASAGDIEAAYQEARAKYDLDLVADLSVELQEHYKRKGAAAKRAYEILTAAPS